MITLLVSGLLSVVFLLLILLVIVMWLMLKPLNNLFKMQSRLINNLTNSNQSLLNQVRTTDPMTLANLQVATSTSSLVTSDNYVPTGTDEDEAVQYEQSMRHYAAGLGEELTEDEHQYIGEGISGTGLVN